MKKVTVSIITLALLFFALGCGTNSSTVLRAKDGGSSGNPVYGIEVTKKRDPIEYFSYHLADDSVVLEKYKGKDSVLEILPSYVIDGQEYKTDLSDFMIGIGNSYVETVIFPEGIEEVKNSVFNSSDVTAVYFPSTMKVVYDSTLAYLGPAGEDKIKIYYAGTQDEWAEIFTEYVRKDISDTEFGEEMGIALADAINEKLGLNKYDSSDFAYYFSASPDDLK